MEFIASESEERNFVEFRASCAPRRCSRQPWIVLLSSLHFTGLVSIVVQNGRVLKSGYEATSGNKLWNRVLGRSF